MTDIEFIIVFPLFIVLALLILRVSITCSALQDKVKILEARIKELEKFSQAIVDIGEISIAPGAMDGYGVGYTLGADVEIDKEHIKNVMQEIMEKE